MNNHGGKRVPGEGRKLGSTKAERLAKKGAEGAASVSDFFKAHAPAGP